MDAATARTHTQPSDLGRFQPCLFYSTAAAQRGVASTPRIATQETALSAQFVPGMRFLVFDFWVDTPHVRSAVHAHKGFHLWQQVANHGAAEKSGTNFKKSF
eukprot:536055-Rhodomonas_salina.2